MPRVKLFLVVLLCSSLAAFGQSEADSLRNVNLDAVLVVAEPIDKAYEVLREAGRRHTPLPSFQCSTAVKSSYGSGNGLSLREALSISMFAAPDRYSERIFLADEHRGGQRLSDGRSAEVKFSVGRNDDLVPQDRAAAPGRHFFESYPDGHLDLYRGSMELPKLVSVPLPSPLGWDAGLQYRARVLQAETKGNAVHWTISVEPRSSAGACVRGTLVIEDSSFTVVRADLELPRQSLVRYTQARVRQTYGFSEGRSVVAERRFELVDASGDTARTQVLHDRYAFDVTYRPKDLGLAAVAYADDAFDASPTDWAAARKIALEPGEARHVTFQDSLTLYYDSDRYKDSVDAVYNKFHWWEPLVSGVGFRSSKKGVEWFVLPVVAQMRFFGVGGYRHNLGGSFGRRLPDQRRLDVEGNLDYGVVNRDLRGDLTLSYLYQPRKFGLLRLELGDNYAFVNTYEPILGTFARGNYVRKTFFQGSHRIELVNGLYLRTSFDFSRRQAITDLKLEDWSNELFGELNAPTPFRTYTIALVGADLSYTPGQRYVMKGPRKIALGSTWPTFTFQARQGIPGLLGGMVNFTSLRLNAKDFRQSRFWGTTNWNAGFGTFLAKELDSIRFIEHRFFRGSDQLLLSNPTTSLQALDSTYHTARPWVEAYLIHHFDRSLLDRIPLVRALHLVPAVGGGMVYVAEAKVFHAEVYGGLELPIRLWDQRARIGAYRVWTDRGTPEVPGFRLKIGMDFYDSYRGRWNY
ncbi:MAG: hypothetical protein RLZZ570_552 [Bacteroidota bacterium]